MRAKHPQHDIIIQLSEQGVANAVIAAELGISRVIVGNIKHRQKHHNNCGACMPQTDPTLPSFSDMAIELGISTHLVKKAFYSAMYKVTVASKKLQLEAYLVEEDIEFMNMSRN